MIWVEVFWKCINPPPEYLEQWQIRFSVISYHKIWYSIMCRVINVFILSVTQHWDIYMRLLLSQTVIKSLILPWLFKRSRYLKFMLWYIIYITLSRFYKHGTVICRDMHIWTTLWTIPQYKKVHSKSEILNKNSQFL